MPAKTKKSQLINLLPQEEFAASTWGRVLAWLLSTFRTIVIISEMIVMGAFLSRFWLDAKNTDLTDAIIQRTAVVSSYANFEADFRSVQKKLTIFGLLADPKPDAQKIIESTGAILPSTMSLTSIAFTPQNTTFKGLSSTEKDLATFNASLKTTGLFTNVTISQISLDETGTLINFDVKALVKEGL